MPDETNRTERQRASDEAQMWVIVIFCCLAILWTAFGR